MRKKYIFIFIVLFYFILFFLWHSCFADTKDAKALLTIQKINFSPIIELGSNKFKARVGNYNLFLENPDDSKKPTAWDSSLKIENRATLKSCETESLLIRDVYKIAEDDMLIIVSYNLPFSYIHFINMISCSNTLPTIKVFTERIVITQNRIIIYPGCECLPESDICDCSSGKVLAIDKYFKVITLKKESAELTKKIIGVEFEGYQKVFKPKTGEASLVK